MARTTLTLLCAVLAAVISTSVAGRLPKSAELDAKTTALLAANPTLGYLGRFENKQYYSNSVDTTWDEADEYCKNLGFELISFDKSSERLFIYEAVGGSGHYWTSALVTWNNEDISVVGDRARFYAGSISGAGEVFVVPGASFGYALCQIEIASE